MFGEFKGKVLQSSCCSSVSSGNCSTTMSTGKQACPKCNQKAKGVLAKTLDHLLKDESKKSLECLEGFYFCQEPSCELIYFRDALSLTQEDLKVVVGLKEGATPATLCYCFKWTKEKIEYDLKHKGSTDALEDIKRKMENPGCSCETLNPSGGCCLGDVTKVIKKLKKDLNI